MDKKNEEKVNASKVKTSLQQDQIKQMRFVETNNALQNQMKAIKSVNLSSGLQEQMKAMSSLMISSGLQEQMKAMSSLKLSSGLQEQMKAMSSLKLSSGLQEQMKAMTKDLFIGIKNIDGIFNYVNEISEQVKNEETKSLSKEKVLFTSEEFDECITEYFENPKNFQQRLKGWVKEKKEQFYFTFFILSFIYQIFIVPYLQQYGVKVTTYVVCNVKELPSKAGNVICKLEKDFEAVIIENSDYYYKVSFIDEKGEAREGWVAKRNLKALDDNEPEK